MDNPFTWLWIGWLGVFVVVEGIALFNKREDDTLSHHIWKWFSLKDETGRFAKLRRTIFLGFMAWLVAHFVTGGWV